MPRPGAEHGHHRRAGVAGELEHDLGHCDRRVVRAEHGIPGQPGEHHLVEAQRAVLRHRPDVGAQPVAHRMTGRRTVPARPGQPRTTEHETEVHRHGHGLGAEPAAECRGHAEPPGEPQHTDSSGVARRARQPGRVIAQQPPVGQQHHGERRVGDPEWDGGGRGELPGQAEPRLEHGDHDKADRPEQAAGQGRDQASQAQQRAAVRAVITMPQVVGGELGAEGSGQRQHRRD